MRRFRGRAVGQNAEPVASSSATTARTASSSGGGVGVGCRTRLADVSSAARSRHHHLRCHRRLRHCRHRRLRHRHRRADLASDDIAGGSGGLGVGRRRHERTSHDLARTSRDMGRARGDVAAVDGKGAAGEVAFVPARLAGGRWEVGGICARDRATAHSQTSVTICTAHSMARSHFSPARSR